MWSYAWPILLGIAANTFYHICAKTTPEGVQPFASLTVTYTVAAALSMLLFFVTAEHKNLFAEIAKTNWTSLAFGGAIIGLEFGYLEMYRAGDICVRGVHIAGGGGAGLQRGRLPAPDCRDAPVRGRNHFSE